MFWLGQACVVTFDLLPRSDELAFRHAFVVPIAVLLRSERRAHHIDLPIASAVIVRKAGLS